MKKPAVIRRFWADDRGATAIEYALIVGIMSVVVVGVAATGGALTVIYERVSLIVEAMGGGDDGG